MAPALVSPGVWSARDTTPAEIESALLKLMHDRRDEERVQAPARVLNLIIVVDHEFKGEVTNRLERINRDNPARTILIVVEDGKTSLDATATLVNEHDAPGQSAVFRERIEIVCGDQHLEHLDTIIYPVLATEVGTVIWSPHGHPEAVDALRGLANSALIDSLEYPNWRDALERCIEISEHAEVSDLAWLRSNPWRERIASTFDPPVWRPELLKINKVTVRMEENSGIAALLWFGWLASRLGWEPGPIDVDAPDHRRGFAIGPEGPIEMVIDNDDTMPVPGLSGVTIETSSGLSISLDRGVGGLRASRKTGNGDESDWTILGASRGEDGILAHGVTNAMLPDPLFKPALLAASLMAKPREAAA
jgi:glucose-6-phosphate dehydrogenase assembly protein OpcA